MENVHLPSKASDQGAYERKAGRLPRHLQDVLNLSTLEQAASRHWPKPMREYVLGAAEDNRSLHANRSDFSDYDWVTRVMVDVSQRTTQTTLWGHTYQAPFGIAPIGISALLAYDGDAVLAESARTAGIPMIMSGSSLTRLEEVYEKAPGTWFQAYLPGNGQRRKALIERIARAGYETLVVTVDIPVWANRENNIRAGFSLPVRPSASLAWQGLTHPRWLVQTFCKTLLLRGMPYFENSFAERGAPAFSAKAVRETAGRDHLQWSDLSAIRQQWRGQLVVKGVLSPHDARQAVSAGADGIIVSNHGGRQLDGAVSALRALPEIADAIGHQVSVMLDGGVRRGSDVLAALALGARLVFAGRPFISAAALGGHAGVAHAIELLRAEVDRNMAMLGVNDVRQLGPDRLRQR